MPTTNKQLEALLLWLSQDSDRAEHEYVRIHERLKNFFKYETLSDLEADKLADDTIDLVAEKLVSSHLSNAGTDILDMPGLCARLGGESGRHCKRLIDFLPESAREIVRAVARIADFQQRGSPLLCSGDLKDLKRLARRLLDEECALSAYLREQLTQDTLQQLRGFRDSRATSGPLEKSLAGELNLLITERRLLEVEHFARIASQNRLLGLMGPGSQHEDHVRLNRVLLVKAFPDEIANSGRHPARLSKALNGLLARRDFYQLADFEAVEHAGESEMLLARGRDALSQEEVERLNRLTLEAAFPQEIAKRLICRQYEDRWPYFEKTARNVYLKHARRNKEDPTDFEPTTSPGGEGRAGGSAADVPNLLSEKFREEIEVFFRNMDSSKEYACLKDCCRKHHAECELVVRYYQVGQAEAGRAVDRKSKTDRKEIAEDEGVSPKVIKMRVHRAKVKLKSCVTDCLGKLIEGGRRSSPGKD